MSKNGRCSGLELSSPLPLCMLLLANVLNSKVCPDLGAKGMPSSIQNLKCPLVKVFAVLTVMLTPFWRRKGRAAELENANA